MLARVARSDSVNVLYGYLWALLRDFMRTVRLFCTNTVNPSRHRTPPLSAFVFGDDVIFRSFSSGGALTEMGVKATDEERGTRKKRHEKNESSPTDATSVDATRTNPKHPKINQPKKKPSVSADSQTVPSPVLMRPKLA